MPNIFVYGTLLSQKIIKKLTGKTFKTSAAVLSGYKKYSIKDCDYPAIIQQDDSTTFGLVIENVDELSSNTISFYEGTEYKKKKVNVLINNNATEVLVYAWVSNYDHLENKKWDLHHFQKYSLQHYLDEIIPETLDEFYKG